MPAFKQIRFINIQSTDELNRRGMLSIRFNDAQERSEFAKAYDPIKLYGQVYTIELHKEEDTLIVIRLPMEAPDKKRILPVVQEGIIDFLKKNCAAYHDFSKQIETVTLHPNHPDSPLEKTVQHGKPEIKNKAKPMGSSKAWMLKLLTLPKIAWASFLNRPSNYPVFLGLITASVGMIGAFILSLSWMSTLISCGLIMLTVVFASVLRNRLFQQEAKRIAPEIQNFKRNLNAGKSSKIYTADLENKAFLHGYQSGTSWTWYFTNFKQKTWLKHPIIFGAGMQCAMNAHSANASLKT